MNAPPAQNLPQNLRDDLETFFAQGPPHDDPQAFTRRLAEAVDQEARRRFSLFLDGVMRYRHHPGYRHLKDPSPCAQRGGTRLRAYGRTHGGTPVLAIPSLINRAYILDLNGQRSLMRYMARRGVNPYLLDWGTPGGEELSFDIETYVTDRLIPLAEEVLQREGRPPVILGYCMGGLLALALAIVRPDLAAGYVSLATPWDFHADTSPQMTLFRQSLPGLVSFSQILGVMPVDCLQAMFSGLDPHAITRKFQNFARLDITSPKAKQFVGLEDWLNDGIPLAGPVAEECLQGWYGNNTPGKHLWTVCGQPIIPHHVNGPCLFFIPDRDRIVPACSSMPLAQSIPQAATFTVPLGHIGMITGSAAVRQVYVPLTRWIKNNFCTT